MWKRSFRRMVSHDWRRTFSPTLVFGNKALKGKVEKLTQDLINVVKGQENIYWLCTQKFSFDKARLGYNQDIYEQIYTSFIVNLPLCLNLPKCAIHVVWKVIYRIFVLSRGRKILWERCRFRNIHSYRR